MTGELVSILSAEAAVSRRRRLKAVEISRRAGRSRTSKLVQGSKPAGRARADAKRARRAEVGARAEQ